MSKKAPAKAPSVTKKIKVKDLEPDVSKAVKGGLASKESRNKSSMEEASK